MDILKNSLNLIKKVFEKRRYYFENAKNEIAEKNLITMQYSTLIGLIALTLLVILTPFLITEWRLTWEYYALFVTLLFFMTFSTIARKTKKINYKVVQPLCILMCILLFGIFIFISLFPSPSQSEIYLSLYIMIMPLLFILKTNTTIPISVIGSAIFIYLVYEYKPEFAPHDTLAVIAAMALSRISSILVYSLRVDDFLVRDKFCKMSNTDSLTSLSNKLACETLCVGYLNSIENDEFYAALMIDLDNFKLINDNHGHKCGDNVLREFGINLRKLFKQHDIVARIGGDEFFVLMKNIDNKSVIENKAKKILEIGNEVEYKIGVHISGSVGVLFSQGSHLTFEALYEKTDKALYKSKHNGKNNFFMLDCQ